MDDRTTKLILRRLKDLERNQVKLRRGVITDDTPLSVALGGADTAYVDVKTIDDGVIYSVDDQVAVLVAGNDLLVIGRIL